MDDILFRDHIRRLKEAVRGQDFATRIIRAGLPAPRQLIINKGKDLNEFCNLSKGET